MKKSSYIFEYADACEMCGDAIEKHEILGQRLNQSQGFSPKTKSGISVTVQRCTKCSLIYTYPRPIPANLLDHYGTPPEDYWVPEYFNVSPDYFSREIEWAKELLTFREGMTALDVGAGIGKCMKAMQNAGFEVYGIEPSDPFYERAQSKMNIPKERLSHTMIENARFEEGFFDFITMGAVVEHLYRPAECIERALKWLKPGGLIHVEVPSSRYFVAKIINFYYWLRGTNYTTHVSPMHAPFHLYEFDITSFEALGEKLNFKVEMHHHDVGDIFFGPKLLHPFLRAYMNATKTGMQLTVFLKKR